MYGYANDNLQSYRHDVINILPFASLKSMPHSSSRIYVHHHDNGHNDDDMNADHYDGSDFKSLSVPNGKSCYRFPS